MNRLNRTPIDTKAYGEILVSLGLAMEQAGGGVDYSNLDNMTAVGLLKLLAPNHIRFSYCPTNPSPNRWGMHREALRWHRSCGLMGQCPRPHRGSPEPQNARYNDCWPDLGPSSMLKWHHKGE